MSLAVPRFATGDDHPVLEGYSLFCHRLDVGDEALRARLRQARAFLAAHPDLDAWMALPVPTRLVDLGRNGAWSFVVWAVFDGRVAIDMDLLAAKHLFGLHQTVETMWPDELDGAHKVAERLRWTPKWARDVIDETLCAVMAHSGRRFAELTVADVDAFCDALDTSPLATTSTRKSWRHRSFGIRQLLYELDMTAAPPERILPRASLAQRF